MYDAGPRETQPTESDKIQLPEPTYLRIDETPKNARRSNKKYKKTLRCIKRNRSHQRPGDLSEMGQTVYQAV